MPRMWKQSVMENNPDYSQNARKIIFRSTGREERPWGGGEGNKKIPHKHVREHYSCMLMPDLYHHTTVQDRKREWMFARICSSQSINSIGNLLHKHLWNVGTIRKVKFFIWCEAESTFLCKHFVQYIFS